MKTLPKLAAGIALSAFAISLHASACLTAVNNKYSTSKTFTSTTALPFFWVGSPVAKPTSGSYYAYKSTTPLCTLTSTEITALESINGCVNSSTAAPSYCYLKVGNKYGGTTTHVGLKIPSDTSFQCFLKNAMMGGSFPSC